MEVVLLKVGPHFKSLHKCSCNWNLTAGLMENMKKMAHILAIVIRMNQCSKRMAGINIERVCYAANEKNLLDKCLIFSPTPNLHLRRKKCYLSVTSFLVLPIKIKDN